MDAAMIEKVVKAKQPECTMRDGDYILDLDGELYEITLDDMDLLFSTMFFRGKLD